MNDLLYAPVCLCSCSSLYTSSQPPSLRGILLEALFVVPSFPLFSALVLLYCLLLEWFLGLLAHPTHLRKYLHILRRLISSAVMADRYGLWCWLNYYNCGLLLALAWRAWAFG